MKKAKVLLVLAFLLVCAAGVVVGTAVNTARPQITERPQPEFRDLNLSSEQQKEMHDIWNKFAKQRGPLFQKRHQLDQQREESFRAMLTPEQLSEYEQIQRTFEQQKKECDEEVHKLYRAADDATRQILSPEQQKKLDEVRQRMPHEKHGPGMGPGMGGPGMGSGMGGPPFPHHEHHRSSTWPSTRPSANPTTAPLNSES
jgi:Spy/CpxP family protein refolding chaperone